MTDINTGILKITQSNFDQFDICFDEAWPRERAAALEAHGSVNDFLHAHLPPTNDWGAKYHQFLSAIGLSAESNNGWWSRDAIRPQNLIAFIQIQTDDDLNDAFYGGLSMMRRALESARNAEHEDTKPEANQ